MKNFKTWAAGWMRGHAPRRFPDPFEHEYCRGWRWGFVCGGLAGTLWATILLLAVGGRL